MSSSYIFFTGTNSKRNTKIYHLIVLFVIIFVPCQILESDLRTCLILQLWWSVWIQVTDSLPAKQHLSCGAVCRFLAAQTSPKLNSMQNQDSNLLCPQNAAQSCCSLFVSMSSTCSCLCSPPSRHLMEPTSRAEAQQHTATWLSVCNVGLPTTHGGLQWFSKFMVFTLI